MTHRFRRRRLRQRRILGLFPRPGRNPRDRRLVLERLEERALLALEPISLADASLFSRTGEGNSLLRQQAASISADGQLVVFQSSANDLAASDTNRASNSSATLSDVFLFNRGTGQTSLLSVNLAGTGSGNGDSFNPKISGDGRYVVFESSATDLAIGASGVINVYVRDLQAGATTLVSANLDHTAGGNATSQNATISADGRYIAFESYASNLVPNDTNDRRDIFVRDLVAGTTTLVSSNLNHTSSGDNDSFDPRISDNGRFVAFVSYAGNLVPNDGTNIEDIFVHDLQTHTTELISISSNGVNQSTAHNALSPGRAISADGRYVLFETRATNLFPVEDGSNVFWRDRQLGTTTAVSVKVDGSAAVGGAGGSMTPDGRFVAFISTAANLVTGVTDANGTSDVFLRDMQTGTTRLVSVNAAGTGTGDRASGTAQYPFDFSAGAPALTADARYIAFASEASNLVAGISDANDSRAEAFGTHRRDVFLRDMAAGTTTLISMSRSGAATGENGSFTPAMSADGKVVAFESLAGDLVNGQDNLGYEDVFVRDVAAGQTQLASQRTPLFPSSRLKQGQSVFDAATPDGRLVAFRNNGVVYVRDRDSEEVTAESVLANGTLDVVANIPAQISADGRFVVFAGASNFASTGPANTTGQLQLWLRDRQTRQTRMLTVNAAGQASAGGVWEMDLSPDGRYVAFSSEATDLISGFVDGNGNNFGFRDVFIRELATGVTRLISHVPQSTVQSGNGPSYAPRFSDDGSKLIFLSRATDLSTGAVDTNADDDIFAYDVATGAVSLVSANLAGTGTGNRAARSPVISGDGRYVAFTSTASDLAPLDNPAGEISDVFVRDLLTSTTSLVSINAAGLLSGSGQSFEPSISGDGRLIAFTSDANDLAAGDSGQRDVFVRDMQTGITTRASLSLSDSQSDGGSYAPVISPSGRFLSFLSFAGNLVPNFADGNTKDLGEDLYVRDLATKFTDLVTVSNSGTVSGNARNDAAWLRQFSTDGSTLFFQADASDLVSGDRNFSSDVFAYQFGGAGQIRGSVFQDVNKDGNRQAGEAGIPFWTVYLDANGNGRLDDGERNAQTDGSGNFAFTGLGTGTYSVAVALASGYSRTAPADSASFSATLTSVTDIVDGLAFAAATAQVDLQAAAVTSPSSAAIGQPIAVSWLVRNVGSDTASGDWQDAVYFSQDELLGPEDTLVAVAPHVGGLAASSSYAASTTVSAPPQLQGGFHVLVQADRRRQVAAEINRGNNLAAGDLTAITLPQITVGVPYDDQFTGVNQQHYYQFTVTPGKSLVLKLDSAAGSGTTELYLRRGDLPTPWEYDSTSRVTGADQELYVPATQTGTYYVLAQSRSGAAATAHFTITASLPGLHLDNVSTNVGGNQGRVTIKLQGTGFTRQTTASLVAGSDVINAAAIDFRDSTLMYATFDLRGKQLGQYSVRLSDPGRADTKSDSFEIIDAGASDLDVDIQLLAPPDVRVPTSFGGGDGYDPRPRILLTYKNNSKVDVPAPIFNLKVDIGKLSIQSHTITDSNGGLQFLGTTTDGPAGYLRPGSEGKIEALFEFTALIEVAETATVTATSSSSLGEESKGLTIDWFQPKAAARPSLIPEDAWDPIWDNFTATVGTTRGQFQQVLDDDAVYLGQFGEDVTDLSRLMGFEIQKADATLPAPILQLETDAFYPAPQIDLGFGREFLQPISGRYRLGPLGRGWAHDWEMQAVQFAGANEGDDGGFRIDSPSGSRYFYRHKGRPDSINKQSVYTADPGDPGEVTSGDHGLAIRVPDGSLTAFRADGKIDYREDSHGIRITAGYDNAGRLISLTHSTGPAINISYNVQGRISQVVDPVGRVTTYAYDNSGEHLISVTDNVGMTQYSYVSGQGAAREHALDSIAYPGGTHQFFHYDERGRLIGQEEDGRANAITYGYEGAGGVTVTDANGAVTHLMYNSNNQLEEVRDALGRRSDFEYDKEHHLVLYVSPSGNEWEYGYDQQGHVTKIVDSLNQTTGMRYEPTKIVGVDLYKGGGLPSIKLGHYRLTKIFDARGNVTTYNYGGINDNGDLRSITYPNRTKEQFTYDPLGNLLESVNRRGNAIQFSYDNRGLVTRKDYADGTHIDYTYDDHGNMLTAKDSQGTTTMTYDTADRLKKVSYPGGRFLQFTYDDGSRRTSSVDQDGFTINYQYDATGRLAGLTDGGGASVVAYHYDAAGYLTRKDLGNSTYTTYEYDPAGQLLSLVNHAPGGGDNSRFDYTYDLEGRRTSMTTADGTTLYTYDATGQLTSVEQPGGNIIRYQYDEVGNLGGTPGIRTGLGSFTPQGFNNMNQNPDYTYDLDGNLTSKGIGSGQTYAYDDENRLIGSSGPDGNWSYQFDALGQRLGDLHDGQQTSYLIDPAGLGDVVAEYGASGLVAHYVHGFGLVSRVAAGGAKSFYDFDAIGNTIGLTNEFGTYVNRYSYLPFGQTTTLAAQVANPFQFVGEFGVMVAGGGLNFMRARYYDPGSGQFVSEDPINFLSGDANLRQYTKSNPVSFIDPAGLISDYAPIDGTPYYRIQTGETGSGKPLYSYIKKGEEAYEKINRDLNKVGQETGKFLRGRDFSRASKIFRDRILKFSGRMAGLGNLAGTLAIGFTIPEASGRAEQLGRHFRPAQKWGENIGNAIAPYFNNPEGRKLIAQIRLSSSFDPNDMQGPNGYGDQHFVGVNQSLPYLITFENDPAKASAPAQEVFVSQQLDIDLDWSTFELVDFGFGSTTISVPAGLQSYATRVNYQNQNGSSLLVDVAASFDQATGMLSWSFRSVDPITGGLPAGVFDGFLPVDDDTHRGQGFVSYLARPKAEAATGTQVDGQAKIIFDMNNPIDTPTVFNTIDAGGPTSKVTPLVALQNRTFTLTWSGADDVGGSGVRTYDIFVSDNNGPYTLLKDDIAATSTSFTGVGGHTYRFYSVATDNVGQQEGVPATFDAQTTLTTHPWFNAPKPLDVDNNGQIAPLDALVVINYLNAGFPTAVPPTALTGGGPGFLDTDANDQVAPLDALLVINVLNAGLGGEGEHFATTESESAAIESPDDLADLIALLATDTAEQTIQRHRRS